MKFLFQIIIITTILAGSSINACAQKRIASRTSSANAAYGNGILPEYKTNKKQTKKMRKKVHKIEKPKKPKNNPPTYWRGKPF